MAGISRSQYFPFRKRYRRNWACRDTPGRTGLSTSSVNNRRKDASFSRNAAFRVSQGQIPTFRESRLSGPIRFMWGITSD